MRILPVVILFPFTFLVVQGQNTNRSFVDYGFKTIPEIQGEGDSSPFENGRVTTTGVVTADFNGAEPYPGAGYSSDLNGYYIQNTDPDDNRNTSEGLFVLTDSMMAVGDSVTLEGLVKEMYGQTVLTDPGAVTIHSSGNDLPDPVVVNLPLSSVTDFERLEGMLVTFPGELTVTENRNLDNYGDLRLSSGGLLFQPTQVVDPNDPVSTGVTASGNSNVAEVMAFREINQARSLILDDARTGSFRKPVPFLGEEVTVPAGSTITGLTGILGYNFGSYRLLPTAHPDFTYAARQEVPVPGGASLKVATFNVLNYFNGDGKGGGFPAPRGARTQAAFLKQTAKIVSALTAMDADVVGLVEMENDADDGYSAIKTLVDALNASAGQDVYDFISTGIISPASASPDEIKVAFIHKTATVEPAGDYALLTEAFSPAFNDRYNRPALAQTFREKATGEKFTAAVVHLKSKGSVCDDLGDPDDGDGQGECNVTRTLAAGTLATWLDSDPTGSGDEDFLILGDLNAYAEEDPIDTLRARGWINLVEGAYTYVFDGRYGTLDYALANASMLEKVTGAVAWNINSTEPDFLAYNGLESAYDPGPYRSSDHDPVIVGLDFATGWAPEVPFKGGSLVLYPVPFTGRLQVRFESDRVQRVTIRVFNASGEEVYQVQHNAVRGSNGISEDLSCLPGGLYIICIPELGIARQVVRE